MIENVPRRLAMQARRPEIENLTAPMEFHAMVIPAGAWLRLFPARLDIDIAAETCGNSATVL